MDTLTNALDTRNLQVKTRIYILKSQGDQSYNYKLTSL